MNRYQHYKSDVVYVVVAHAICESTKEAMVVYKAEDGCITWVRPAKEFFGKVDCNGKSVNRFSEIGADE